MITVVKASAAFCQPCKLYAPTFNAVALEYFHNYDVEFESRDADDSPEFFKFHNLRSVPVTLVLGEDGKEIVRKVGNLSKEELNQLVGSVL